MKKADLKTGMVVETRNGEKYLVMLNPDCEGRELISFYSGFMSLDRYTDDLLFNEQQYIEEFSPDTLDIIKIYSVKESIRKLIRFPDELEFTLLWEREEGTKEMTVAEIEKELGYTIKIVGDRDEE